ncbi:ATP-dependent RecD-like DNA helicase [Ureibacillus thermosphaericus]|uniref:SF1B family DNA helicase RecD2 n=1 Tax=Ureibacillus thermosphaericus TaxID=51173 RepID=UPI0030C9B1B4
MKVEENFTILKTTKTFVLGRPIVSIFHNASNMYSIVKVKIKETNLQYTEKEITVVGYFPTLDEEHDYRFFGSLKHHPKYGIQFQVEMFEREVPATEQGVIHYLSSDLFPGIGPKTAELIVKTLGTDALKKMMENPQILDEVPRLSEEKKMTIRSTLEQNLGLDKIMIQLNEWGFGPQLGMKIYQTYREETIHLLTENPYRLIEEVEGVGFTKADELGSKIGITGNHPDRIKAAVLHVLNQAALSEGHVYLEAEHVLPEVKGMLEQSQPVEIPFESISKAVIELEEEGKICGEETRIYLPSLYFSEVGIATKILHFIKNNEHAEKFSKDEIRKAIGEAEERLEVTYAEKQAKAIEQALNSSVMILTGGPGTGKTTVIRGLVEVYAELHGISLDPKEYAKREEPFPIILAAPTGRAAKRLSESTGLPAMTIHRLLGFNGQEKEEESDREIEGRLVIIDEMSMVDTWLSHQLLKSIPLNAQVVLVGDQDQLPPVGPGQVLKDLLASKVVPTIELTEVYRQADGSTIIELAHQIKKGQIPTNFTEKTTDRSFIKASKDQIASVVTQVVKSALAKGQSIRDIQVLAPMYKGPAGIDYLNKEIQELVNSNEDGTRKEVKYGDTIFRIGDKVLQLVNQPESNVFNGDIGEIVAILKAKETVEKQDIVVVSYDGNEVTYERSDLNQITLAYCCSIHKAQGSEFQTVIMPIVRSYSKMLRRNLIYTGITRAKNYLILCGEPEEFMKGIQRTDDLKRFTTLRARLNPAKMNDDRNQEMKMEGEKLDEQIVHLSPDDCNEQQTTGDTTSLPPVLNAETAPKIHPMIGMDGITPYDFLDE